jgi:hypothetical protein
MQDPTFNSDTNSTQEDSSTTIHSEVLSMAVILKSFTKPEALQMKQVKNMRTEMFTAKSIEILTPLDNPHKRMISGIGGIKLSSTGNIED